jgi:hypothetical protein
MSSIVAISGSRDTASGKTIRAKARRVIVRRRREFRNPEKFDFGIGARHAAISLTQFM